MQIFIPILTIKKAILQKIINMTIKYANSELVPIYMIVVSKFKDWSYHFNFYYIKINDLYDILHLKKKVIKLYSDTLSCTLSNKNIFIILEYAPNIISEY